MKTFVNELFLPHPDPHPYRSDDFFSMLDQTLFRQENEDLF